MSDRQITRNSFDYNQRRMTCEEKSHGTIKHLHPDSMCKSRDVSLNRAGILWLRLFGNAATHEPGGQNP